LLATAIAVVVAAASTWAALPFAATARADQCKTTDWIGTVSDEWTNGSNWDNGVPASCDTVNLDGGGTPHPDITQAQTIDLAKLTITPGTTVDGAGDTVISATTIMWSGGISDVSLTAHGVLTLSGTPVLRNGNDPTIETLTNNGTATMAPGTNLELDQGAKVVNGTGGGNGEWDAIPTQAGSFISGDVCCNTLDTFVNRGILDGADAGITMQDMGYVGTATGSVHGEVVLDAGSDTLRDGTTVSGHGSKLELADDSTVAVAGTIHLNGGGEIVQETDARVTGTAVTFKGTSASGPNEGSYHWQSGSISASPTFATGARLVVEGADGKTLDGSNGHGTGLITIDLGTSATEQGAGTLTLSKAAIVNNGIWKIPNGQVVHMAGDACCAARPNFRNNRTLQIGAGSTFDFNNAHFIAGGTGIVTGGTLDLGEGLHPFDDGTHLGSGVTVLLDRGGTMGGSGTITLQPGSSLVQEGGATILGAHQLAGSGSYTWSSGTISGQLDVGPSVTTHITDLAADSSHVRSLTTVGTKVASLTVEGGASQSSATPISLGAATEVTNRIGSTWTIHNGGLSGGVCCADPAIVTNLGTLVVNASSPGSSGDLQLLAFRNRGTFHVSAGTASFLGVSPLQTAGSTVVGGTLSTTDPFELKAGTLTGAGAITGSLENTGGTLSPGAPIGTLHVSGDYTQSTGGTFLADLQNSSVDLLVVGGTATLAGTLKLHLMQSGGLSRLVRTLVSAHSVASPFTTVSGLGTLGSTWAVKKTPTKVLLSPV
jgi:hypothetical protein